MATPHVHATIRAAAAPSMPLDLRAADALVVRSSRHSAKHGVQVQEQLFRALHTSADSLAAADHLMREGAVCTRLCTRYLRRCHAAPVWYGSELEL